MSYFTDTIAKLKGITSEHSDQLAFIDHPWVNIIDGKVRATYYFKHDEELLVIESTGITRKGTWELLPNIDSILIQYGEKNQTLKRVFIDRAIMVFEFGDEKHLYVNSNKVEEANKSLISFYEDHIEKQLAQKVNNERLSELERQALDAKTFDPSLLVDEFRHKPKKPKYFLYTTIGLITIILMFEDWIVQCFISFFS